MAPVEQRVFSDSPERYPPGYSRRGRPPIRAAEAVNFRRVRQLDPPNSLFALGCTSDAEFFFFSIFLLSFFEEADVSPVWGQFKAYPTEEGNSVQSVNNPASVTRLRGQPLRFPAKGHLLQDCG